MLSNGADDQNTKAREEIANWDEEKTRLHEVRQKRGLFNNSPEDEGHLQR